MDNYYALKFVTLLTRPWTETDAFKLGLIDDKGNVLNKGKQRTPAEQESLTKFHLLVFNIKKMLEKLPLGKTTIARYAAALYLLKEHMSPALVEKDTFIVQFVGFVHEHQIFDESICGMNTNTIREILENTKYLQELDGATAGGGGSVTTGVDGLDTVLGTGKTNKPKKKRQQLWKTKTY